jgi:transmembrane sensor
MIQYNNIDDILVKVLLGESTDEELRLVQGWREESAANERYFQDFRRIWEESRNLAVRSEVNEEVAWDSFRRRVRDGERSLVKDGDRSPVTGEAAQGREDGMGDETEREADVVEMKPRKSYRWLMAAAAILVVAAGGWFFYGNGPVQYLAVSSGGQVLLDTLPEGSLVTLNKQSSIRYIKGFAGADRRIDMEGEAFFAVSQDKNRPFVVQTNGMTITVLGTSFNVKNIGGKTEVIVETGMVEVRKGGEVLRVRAHERVVSDGSDEPLVREKNPDQLYDYYRTHVFECNGTPLWRLVEKLNEVYKVHIVIENEQKRNLQETTSFVDESLEEILKIITKTFSMTYEYHGDKIILK